ncbi:MAG: NAD(P)/FAD-dependent oxidoreductase [Endomicrobia bacterium]|nr:NAD(P)/FAD-dependent oxidoreductase [Endomicrobiia bacterium]
MKYDVIVIGSGISGLTSALLFAKRGKSVAVAEQAAHIAPLISGFDRVISGKSAHFETGFHYSSALGANEAGGRLLKELGLNIPAELCDSDSYDELHFLKSGKKFKMPFGRQRLESALARAYPHEKESIAAYLDLQKKVVAGVPFLGTAQISDFERFFALSSDARTLQEVLDAHFKDEELKILLSYQSMLYGTPPSKVSFVLHCCCTALMNDSVWKIKGGGGSLINTYEDALKKYGVSVFTNKKAVKIAVNAGGVKTVYFEDGGLAECETCVVSAHPKEFLKMAPPEVYRKKHAQRIADIEETPSFFVLYGVLSGKEKRYRCENMAFCGSESFNAAESPGEITPLYINFSNTDPQTVCLVGLVKPDEPFWNRKSPDYKEKKRLFSEALKSKFEKICPELAGKISYCCSAAPAAFKKYLNYCGGYGIMHCANDAAILPVTKIQGLFLTGQAVVTPGLLGALISSFLLDAMLQRGNDADSKSV